jgi:PAS domain S-box-containing protein
MTRGQREGDRLSGWLSGDGLATLDGIMGGALDVIGVVDRDLTIRYLNWTVAGLERESLVGRSVLELVPPAFVELSRDTYLTVLRTGVGARFETMYRDGDVVLLWEVRVGPIRCDGEIIGLIVITSNVTEQRQAQADRDRFFSLSLDMLVVVTSEGRCKRLNPAFGETLGYEVSELSGMLFIELVHPDDRSRTLEAFRSVLGGTPVTDFENRYVRKDGASRVFSWRATVDPVTGDVYAVARDITEHRATEAQLRHAQKMEAVGQLAGGIAHDFNNLLQTILANAELATQGGRSSSQLEEHLAEIAGAGRRAADLTKQLLAFSRRQPLRLVPIDLNQLVRGLMKMLRRLLPESIGIELVAVPNLASVSADPTQLEQVLVNLCVNARDAMERGGQLTIRTQNVVLDGRFQEVHRWAKPGDYVLLSVTDTGSGMTNEVRERIFEPFFTTKGGHRGTGLGLSTAYGIVEQHGGMIHVETEPGRGATFTIYLPSDDRLAKDLDEPVEAAHPRGAETILLAEDEELVRRVVVHILEGAGYRTIAVSNGTEAIRRLKEHGETVHLALLDVVMPVLGGAETWESLRGLRDGLRVLFMSGYADARSREQLPKDAELIEKPFRREELLRCVRRILDGDP